MPTQTCSRLELAGLRGAARLCPAGAAARLPRLAWHGHPHGSGASEPGCMGRGFCVPTCLESPLGQLRLGPSELPLARPDMAKLAPAFPSQSGVRGELEDLPSPLAIFQPWRINNNHNNRHHFNLNNNHNKNSHHHHHPSEHHPLKVVGFFFLFHSPFFYSPLITLKALLSATVTADCETHALQCRNERPSTCRVLVLF